jgi:thiol:disulfide interchange protein DsbA
MRRYGAALLGLLGCVVVSQAYAAQTWTEGKNYFLVSPAQRTSVPAGKVEVMEVFSYGCPACNAFVPVVQKLESNLPASAKLVYLPASFVPSEDWPMFQRAFFAAQALGIADRTHDAMFDAIWKSGELATSDPATHQLKKPLPSIEDAARFYAHTGGVKPEAFLAAANSFGVDAKMKGADAQVMAMQVDRTPTIIVNGKYRLHAESAGGYDQLIELVNYLVAKESK